ncbi:cytochrome c [Aquimarina sp. U1-2]|uniref:c-type cytochrome n=1 Tax=Aquimarina sp. U1-2 TaxID=2823141 RepID=UPI001AECD585|nr:cytochrome c [Aquimarina sp. U1-2]MBP2834017.1 cytochrome c [Aquimarina sp. U1-2]
MKTIFMNVGFICLLIFGSCKEQKKSDNEPLKIGVQKQNATSKSSETKATVPVMLENKGIGPITSISFEPSIDRSMAEKGARLFKTKCTACHKANQPFIGPPMAGIFEKRSPEWVMNMIMNPTEMLEKDPVAKALLKAYNNTIMINQNIPESEARAMLEWFRTLK